MGQSSVRREGTRGRVPHARELGWDESLYDEDGTGPRPAGGGPGDGGDSRTGHRRGKPRRRAKKAGKRRVFRWIAVTLSLLILGTASAGYLYYQHLNSNIRSGGRSGGESGVKKTAPNALGDTPLNILLIGSDSRNSAANVKLGGSRDTVGEKPRADVQMLLHISADRKSASMVSIPRDTIVEIPECKDTKTGETFRPTTTTPINESLQRGGPGCTLTTWEKLTGVYINHWVMIDFAGVVAMADAIGGVDVCVKTGVWDRPTRMVPGGSGLKLPEGTSTVKGEDALKWLRTRHAFGNDQNRARAQHMYMNSMLRTLKEQNVWSDAGRLMNLAETGTKALQVSDELGSVKKLFDLSMQLKNVPLNRITMTTIPTVEWSQNKDRLVPVDKSADKMWRMLRDDVAFDKNGKPAGAKPSTSAKPTGPAAAAPSTLGITVINGTGGEETSVVGRAGGMAETLRGEGFTQAAYSQSAEPRKDTVIKYPQQDGEQGKSDALSVAKVLGLPTTAVKADTKVRELTLVIGADWREGATYKNPKPEAGDLPDGADDLNAADTGDCMDVYYIYKWDGKS